MGVGGKAGGEGGGGRSFRFLGLCPWKRNMPAFADRGTTKKRAFLTAVPASGNEDKTSEGRGRHRRLPHARGGGKGPVRPASGKCATGTKNVERERCQKVRVILKKKYDIKGGEAKNLIGREWSNPRRPSNAATKTIKETEDRELESSKTGAKSGKTRA